MRQYHAHFISRADIFSYMALEPQCAPGCDISYLNWESDSPITRLASDSRTMWTGKLDFWWIEKFKQKEVSDEYILSELVRVLTYLSTRQGSPITLAAFNEPGDDLAFEHMVFLDGNVLGHFSFDYDKHLPGRSIREETAHQYSFANLLMGHLNFEFKQSNHPILKIGHQFHSGKK